MIETTNTALARATEREAQLSGLLAKVLSAAQPGAVYSDPISKGPYTVITASEVSAGGGFGSGVGLSQPTSRQREATANGSPLASDASPQSSAQPVNSGGGMGGGGGSSGRPVALIIIGADGVQIRPVVDVTKIALAGVTVLGTVVALLWRMRVTRRPRP